MKTGFSFKIRAGKYLALKKKGFSDLEIAIFLQEIKKLVK